MFLLFFFPITYWSYQTNVSFNVQVIFLITGSWPKAMAIHKAVTLIYFFLSNTLTMANDIVLLIALVIIGVSCNK